MIEKTQTRVRKPATYTGRKGNSIERWEVKTKAVPVFNYAF